MMDLVGPKLVILLGAAVGFVGWGFDGIVAGVALAVALSLALGAILRRRDGGLLPRRVREQLVGRILAEADRTVRSAFPGLSVDALPVAVSGEVERLARRALLIAPSQDFAAVFSAENMSRAVEDLVATESVPARRELMRAIGARIKATWYAASPDGGSS